MVTDEAVVDVVPKYFGNVLSAYENGCQMDLRVKLAVEFLKSPAFGEQLHRTANQVATAALDLATELLDVAAARGLMKDLPDHGDLTAPLRHHIERNARVQVYGQVVGERAMREERGGVMPAAATMHHPSFPG